MADKSWGVPTGNPGAVAGADGRAERLKAFEERAQARAAGREAAAQDRERARDARREEEQARRANAQPPETPRRRSGRRDVVGEQRDTSGYGIVKDVERMRELAKRGASAAGLATAFGISVEEVEAALAD